MLGSRRDDYTALLCTQLACATADSQHIPDGARCKCGAPMDWKHCITCADAAQPNSARGGRAAWTMSTFHKGERGVSSRGRLHDTIRDRMGRMFREEMSRSECEVPVLTKAPTGDISLSHGGQELIIDITTVSIFKNSGEVADPSVLTTHGFMADVAENKKITKYKRTVSN